MQIRIKTTNIERASDVDSYIRKKLAILHDTLGDGVFLNHVVTITLAKENHAINALSKRWEATVSAKKKMKVTVIPQKNEQYEEGVAVDITPENRVDGLIDQLDAQMELTADDLLYPVQSKLTAAQKQIAFGINSKISRAVGYSPQELTPHTEGPQSSSATQSAQSDTGSDGNVQ